MPAEQIKTLASVHKQHALIHITFYHDYDADNRNLNNRIFKEAQNASAQQPPIHCSLFSIHTARNRTLVGRNFDNPPCDTLLVLTRPATGYASFAFTRLPDVGFAKGSDPVTAPFCERSDMLKASFFAADGMNEKGLVAALAAVKPHNNNPSPDKAPCFITLAVRHILDQAATVEEAADIVNSYNVFDMGAETISHHILVADASGGAAVLEHNGTHWQVIRSATPWLVAANSPLFARTEKERQLVCPRYRIAATCLQKGVVTDWHSAMGLLRNIAGPPNPRNMTDWSVIYALSDKTMYLVLNAAFDKVYRIGFPEPTQIADPVAKIEQQACAGRNE